MTAKQEAANRKKENKRRGGTTPNPIITLLQDENEHMSVCPYAKSIRNASKPSQAHRQRKAEPLQSIAICNRWGFEKMAVQRNGVLSECPRSPTRSSVPTDDRRRRPTTQSSVAWRVSVAPNPHVLSRWSSQTCCPQGQRPSRARSRSCRRRHAR